MTMNPLDPNLCRLTRDLIRSRMGFFSFKFNDWWCRICGHTIGADLHDSAFYKQVIVHYKYVHKTMFVMLLLTKEYEKSY